MIRALLIAAAVMLCGVLPASAADAPAAKAGQVFDHVLPNVPGKSLKAVVVEYPPGVSSPAHVHAKSAFIFAMVLEGEVRSQVNDGPVKIYHQGETFAEMPGDRHMVSGNASQTEPAKLLAVFVVDTDETVLTTPLPK